MPRLPRALLASAAVFSLAVLAAQAEPTAWFEPRERPPDEPEEQWNTDPTGLVGLWYPEDLSDDRETVLRLAPPGALSLWPDCGPVFGEWRATAAGLFVASVSGWTGDCQPGTPLEGWLIDVARFRIEADGPVLLDRDGDLVTRLTPGDPPSSHPSVADQLREPPEVTDAHGARVKTPPALPAGYAPATPAVLVGRWGAAPAGSNPGAPYLEFDPDGQWRGSDGCNAQGGRWVADQTGAIAATSGIQTLIGCDNVDVGSWLTTAVIAGLDGNRLVLLDRHGEETGRLFPLR